MCVLKQARLSSLQCSLILGASVCDAGEASNKKRLRRKRANIACLLCRTRKVRCLYVVDPAKEACDSCYKRGLSCEFPPCDERDDIPGAPTSQFTPSHSSHFPQPGSSSQSWAHNMSSSAQFNPANYPNSPNSFPGHPGHHRPPSSMGYGQNPPRTSPYSQHPTFGASNTPNQQYNQYQSQAGNNQYNPYQHEQPQSPQSKYYMCYCETDPCVCGGLRF
ncbi:hypothetical protein R3P38DRAFT_303993 [Favolaschia claudopus]|uniref:Zn(2)-C6 fungal-type domain-containing protein n=1 Tax=Favolaschia claudopus TaxID=2862362 RepID=A0AAW0CPI2_9AGAR